MVIFKLHFVFYVISLSEFTDDANDVELVIIGFVVVAVETRLRVDFDPERGGF